MQYKLRETKEAVEDVAGMAGLENDIGQTERISF